MQWHCQPLTALAPATLYQLLRLRQQVFVVEQMCPYPDLDDRDPACLHLWADDAHGVLACLRIVPGTLTESGLPALGRVCTATRARGAGIGRELVLRGLQALSAHYPGVDCVIGAQAYLRRFYESVGFVVFGAPYREDGIPHFHMRWPANGSDAARR